MMRKLLIFMTLVLFLAGCNSNFDPKEYKMPSEYETQVFEVAQVDGHKLESYEFSQKKEANLSKIWEDWKAKKEGADKYDMITKVYHDDSEQEAEEEELKYYCESLFSNSCLEMEYMKDHNGCREVVVKCDKYNSDDVCIKYDIDISEERLDDDVCE